MRMYCMASIVAFALDKHADVISRPSKPVRKMLGMLPLGHPVWRLRGGAGIDP